MIPGNTDTEIPGYKDTVIPGYKDTVIPWNKDTVIPGYKDTMIPWNKNRVSRVQGSMDTRIQRYMVYELGIQWDARIRAKGKPQHYCFRRT